VGYSLPANSPDNLRVPLKESRDEERNQNVLRELLLEKMKKYDLFRFPPEEELPYLLAKLDEIPRADTGKLMPKKRVQKLIEAGEAFIAQRVHEHELEIVVVLVSPQEEEKTLVMQNQLLITPLNGFTPRQIEALTSLFIDGKTQRRAAEDMGIRQQVVLHHKKAGIKKLRRIVFSSL